MRTALLRPLAAFCPQLGAQLGGVRHYSDRLTLRNDRDAAERYSVIRPHYEQLAVPWILAYYFKKNPKDNSRDHKIDLAIDVGCGPGQMSVELAKYCRRVVGIDHSEEQIKQAKVHGRRPNVEYRVGAAENLSAECGPNEADLVVGGMVTHFFESDKFMGEVKKCLRSGGVVGLLGYHACGYEHEGEELKNAFDDYLRMQMGHHKFYQGLDRELKGHYRRLEFPFNDVSYLEEDMNIMWTREQVDHFLDRSRHLFKYPHRRPPFPSDHNKAMCRLRVFGVVGRT